jgi:hypothetical protein
VSRQKVRKEEPVQFDKHKSLCMMSLTYFLFVLFCLDTKKNEKKSSTNTAPLPTAGRLAAAHARVGPITIGIRARPHAEQNKLLIGDIYS